MAIKAATVYGGGGGATILCSHRLGLFNGPNFLSLNRPSATSHPNSRIRQSFFTCEDHSLIKPYHHRLRHVFITRAADSTQPSSADLSIVPDEEFSLAKVSFGVIGLSLGVSLLSYGFGAYFNILPGSEWSAIMLTYGFPLAIIGMALKVKFTFASTGIMSWTHYMISHKYNNSRCGGPLERRCAARAVKLGRTCGGVYAELKPVPCLTYSNAQMLREKCATPILKQVRNDVTRYRYGDEQHLDEALKRIFQYGQGGGIPRRSAPVLQMIREEVTEDGKYCLVLVFEAKALQLSDFERRQAKFTSFFGPGITAEVGKGEKDLYEVRLISNTTS
ncbi:hypothetical protein HYC85_005666 [Camellia sinensis]|uniref:Thylakoid membrane protein slr0575 n=1 Tax=Camellia sinensis TaxID=4442 RepID=A0A7J7I1M0_CAMSI|nr:hypothetical protein HYC85_005666 [Camellia sinensis]